jgi:hypothetical protein
MPCRSATPFVVRQREGTAPAKVSPIMAEDLGTQNQSHSPGSAIIPKALAGAILFRGQIVVLSEKLF